MARMRLRPARVVAAVGVSAAMWASCGGDDDSQAESETPRLPSAAAIEKDPYAIQCGHVQYQQKWADVTRRATVAIADREELEGLNRLQATQSLFFAMTEVCKGRPANYEPAGDAVAGVRSGTYRTDLGAP